MANPFPTIFARIIATGCELYIPDEDRGQAIEEYLEKVERLIVFQQISIASSFETSLQAYYEYELSDFQKEQLKLIYDTTRAWLLGHLAGHLLDALENKLANGRDKKEIVQTFLEAFVTPTSTEQKRKGLLVEFADKNGFAKVPKIITPKSEDTDDDE